MVFGSWKSGFSVLDTDLHCNCCVDLVIGSARGTSVEFTLSMKFKCVVKIYSV